MDSKRLEQTKNSKDRKVLKGINFKDFSAVCSEYQIVEKATRELLEIATDKQTPVRTRADIFKWIIEMNIGKPKQRDEKDEQEPVTFVIRTNRTNTRYIDTNLDL